MDCTKSSGGRKLLRSWFLRPSRDADVLMARHDFVEYFVHAERTGIVDAMRTSLSACGNIGYILGGMQVQPRLSDWQTVLNARPFPSLLW